TPHSPLNPPSGCVFHPRCPYVMDICPKVVPPLQTTQPNHQVACHLYDGTGRTPEVVAAEGRAE
ncbi:MAG TPA: oligopeptide/dipeptide ABC transporter ATP-binding protein, partial [Thermomicrobiales bacterium]|nr:oligopeptide/dipeptide ABC transporter ATP-binding protein [Thermomicrobiales bacterium]